jgi:hypothetical protein
MKRGDWVFSGDQLVAIATQNRYVAQDQELVFTWISEGSYGYLCPLEDEPSPLSSNRGYLRRIFKRGDVQHWEVSLYGDTKDNIWMGNLFEKPPSEPGVDPSGMVSAIGVLMRDLIADSYVRPYLQQAQDYYSWRAKPK